MKAPAQEKYYEVLLKELDNDEKDNIIKDIYDFPCYKYWNDPPQSIGGIAIKIYYQNKEYEIITESCCAYYKNDKVNFRWEYFKAGSFDSLIEPYIEIIQ